MVFVVAVIVVLDAIEVLVAMTGVDVAIMVVFGTFCFCISIQPKLPTTKITAVRMAKIWDFFMN